MALRKQLKATTMATPQSEVETEKLETSVCFACGEEDAPVVEDQNHDEWIQCSE